MTNFEKITESPTVLAEFLRSLPVIDGPWDEEFHRRYCDGCGAVDCDGGSRCPHMEQRNNPGWWLNLPDPSAGKMGELHRIFADGTLGHEERMEAFNAETKREAELAKRIWGLIMAEDPEPEQIETVLDTANTLLKREIVRMNFNI